MSCYIAENQNAFRYINSNILELLSVLMFAWLGELLFSDGYLSILFVVGYAIYYVIRIAWSDRIKQVVFDQDNKEVVIFYTHFWERKVEKFPFNEMKIKVHRKQANSFQFLAAPVSITVYKGLIEYFTINETKDGFRPEILEEIILKTESLSIPVKEKLL